MGLYRLKDIFVIPCLVNSAPNFLKILHCLLKCLFKRADMVQAQHNALTAFSADESIGAILVGGTPKAFCAGDEIHSLLSPCWAYPCALALLHPPQLGDTAVLVRTMSLL